MDECARMLDLVTVHDVWMELLDDLGQPVDVLRERTRGRKSSYLGVVVTYTCGDVTNPGVHRKIRKLRVRSTPDDRVEQTHVPVGPIEYPEKRQR